MKLANGWNHLLDKAQLHLRTTLQVSEQLFVVTPNLSLKCGQCFRWKPVQKDGSEIWCGVVGKELICLKEEGEEVLFKLYVREFQSPLCIFFLCSKK
jgi:hypothetical protein